MIKNIAKLVKGTLIAQIISLIFYPIITRLYSPETFGEFSLIIGIASFFTVIATLRFEFAILLPKSAKNTKSIMIISSLSPFVIALIFFLAVLLMDLFDLLHLESFGWSSLYYIQFLIIIYGLNQSLYYWSNRNNNYNVMANSRITNSLIYSVTSIVCAFFTKDVFGLLIGYLLGYTFSVFYLVSRNSGLISDLKNNYNFKRIKYNIKKYKNFPLFNSFHALLDIASVHGIIILMSFYYNSYYVGLFTLTWRVLKMPLTFLGGAVSQIYTKQAADLYKEKKSLTKLFHKVTISMFFISLPIFLFLFTFGEKAFLIIFGNEWGESGKYMLYLIPWLMINFIGSSITQTVIILKKQKNALVLAIIQTTLILATIIYSGINKLSFENMLIYLSLTGTVTTLIYGIWIYSQVRKLKGD